MSLHRSIIDVLKARGIQQGYTIERNTFPVSGRRNVVVDVSWRKNDEIKVWEVELKARYDEKLFKFHLLKENYPNVSFGLVVQRDDSRKQVGRLAQNYFSEKEKESLDVKTIRELTGQSIEETSKPIHPLFWDHRSSPKMCVALFSPCAFEDGYNRGIRLTGIHLRDKGYSLEEIEGYLIWLAGKLGLPEFETRSAIKQIAEEGFPSCETIREAKKGRGPYILKLGDLNLQDVCSHCPTNETEL
jgi:hypothetical protein